jgi:triacylglycerol lipase
MACDLYAVPMSTDAARASWFRLPFPPLPILPLRLWSEWMSTFDRRSWPEPPPGDGRPVLMIPGFLAGDPSLTRMAVWLRDGGYVPVRSGITANVACLEPMLGALQSRLQEAVDRAGRPALVVGQSRGGCVGRALAVMRPDLVDTLVTLGSPLRDQLAVHAHVYPSIVAVTALGTAGVPGMFSISCLRGDCCVGPRDALRAPLPDHVRFLSLYSRSDEVVRWRACLDPAADNLEVDASHIGMGVARSVWTAVADALSGRPALARARPAPARGFRRAPA